MTETVPVREVKVYQTDDGRRIEVFSLCGSVKYIHHEGEEIPNKGFSKEDTIYIGTVHIMTEVGPREIKFEINGVKSKEEAFDRYHEIATLAVEEMKQRWEEHKKEMESQIITAPADALDAIDDAQGEGTIIL